MPEPWEENLPWNSEERPVRRFWKTGYEDIPTDDALPAWAAPLSPAAKRLMRLERALAHRVTP